MFKVIEGGKDETQELETAKNSISLEAFENFAREAIKIEENAEQLRDRIEDKRSKGEDKESKSSKLVVSSLSSLK